MPISALFVARDSIYKTMGLDCWDIDRDARLFTGPGPVICHPPCQLWGKMANVNFARWGGEHNRPGNDGGCFEAAVGFVNRYGGVLEHPGDSYAWGVHGLVRPPALGWGRSADGWVCEIWQSAYGHRANKRTWLYYRGSGVPLNGNWSRPVGTHQVGFQDQRGKARNKPTLSRREANATPVAFAQFLVALVS